MVDLAMKKSWILLSVESLCNGYLLLW